jgi:hypothetical protein
VRQRAHEILDQRQLNQDRPSVRITRSNFGEPTILMPVVGVGGGNSKGLLFIDSSPRLLPD